jgi:hypothetical protein
VGVECGATGAAAPAVSCVRVATIGNTGDMPEGTLRAIPRQAGIDPQDFLKS